MYIPNKNKQNYHFFRSKFLVRHYLFGNYQSKCFRNTQSFSADKLDNVIIKLLVPIKFTVQCPLPVCKIYTFLLPNFKYCILILHDNNSELELYFFYKFGLAWLATTTAANNWLVCSVGFIFGLAWQLIAINLVC